MSLNLKFTLLNMKFRIIRVEKSLKFNPHLGKTSSAKKKNLTRIKITLSLSRMTSFCPLILKLSLKKLNL